MESSHSIISKQDKFTNSKQIIVRFISFYMIVYPYTEHFE